MKLNNVQYLISYRLPLYMYSSHIYSACNEFKLLPWHFLLIHICPSRFLQVCLQMSILHFCCPFRQSYISGASASRYYWCHYNITMNAVASQINGDSIVCSDVWSGTDQIKLQSSASLAFVSASHRLQMDSPLKGPVTWTCFHLMTSSLYSYS